MTAMRIRTKLYRWGVTLLLPTVQFTRSRKGVRYVTFGWLNMRWSVQLMRSCEGCRHLLEDGRARACARLLEPGDRCAEYEPKKPRKS